MVGRFNRHAVSVLLPSRWPLLDSKLAMKLLAPRSLWFRLFVGLLSLSLIAIGLASAMFLYRFRVTNLQFREQTLEAQASVIANVLKRAGSGEAIQLSDLSDGFRDGQGRYAVISERGELVAASMGVKQPLAPVNTATSQDFFIIHGTNKAPLFYGVSTKGTYAGNPVFIQIAFASSGSIFDTAFKAFARDIAIIWAAFVIVTLSFNLIMARVGLSPLRNAAARAAAIGPADVSVRIPEKGLPEEVLALVKAVNRALDRLQQAFEAQKGFIADAAHELRTPVAVLKAHAAVFAPSENLSSLKHEIGDLERLVNQLLDQAKLDGLEVRANDRADLGVVASEVATYMGPVAANDRKAVELEWSGKPQIINGSHDFLFRALRNLVENALRHTPPGSSIIIKVGDGPAISVRDWGPGVPLNKREIIFQRFWQGKRDRGGAGLGMDIAARTVRAHGGDITVDDAQGGGAVFTLRFSPLKGGD